MQFATATPAKGPKMPVELVATPFTRRLVYSEGELVVPLGGLMAVGADAHCSVVVAPKKPAVHEYCHTELSPPKRGVGELRLA